MVYLLATPVSFQASHTQHARATGSSGIASLHGKPAKTPIIAGSVCGGVILIAWTIGFIIYFRKRYIRKKEKRAAIAAGLPPPELKSRPEMEKVIIPPDPATIFNQRRPGYETAPGKTQFQEVDLNVGRDRRNGAPTGFGERSDVRGGAEDESPLLSTLPDLTQISPPKRYRTK